MENALEMGLGGILSFIHVSQITDYRRYGG